MGCVCVGGVSSQQANHAPGRHTKDRGHGITWHKNNCLIRRFGELACGSVARERGLRWLSEQRRYVEFWHPVATDGTRPHGGSSADDLLGACQRHARAAFLAVGRARIRPLETGPSRLPACRSSVFAGIFLPPLLSAHCGPAQIKSHWLKCSSGVLWISGRRRAALMMMLMAVHSEAAVWGNKGPGRAGGKSSL